MSEIELEEQRAAIPGISAGRGRLDCVELLGAMALLPVFVLIHYLCYWTRFEFQLKAADVEHFGLTVGWVVWIKAAIFWRFRICRGWMRPVTFYDLVALVQAATAAMVAILLIDRLLFASPAIPRSVFLLDYGTTICVLGGLRSLVRGFREMSWPSWIDDGCRSTILIAANASEGELVLRAMRRCEKANYRIVGFVVQDATLLGTLIGGVRVVGSTSQVRALVDRHRVDQIFVIQGELSGKQLRQLVEDVSGSIVRVKVLPRYEQLIRGELTVQPRPVQIDDLLHRDPVRLDPEGIRKWIDDRVLMVTGSCGSIGSEICRQLLNYSPAKIVVVDRAETGQFFLERELRQRAGNTPLEVCIADVLDKPRMRVLLKQHRPSILFHAAAYKHVPLMEQHPGEAVRNIVTATRRLADVAQECGVESFVMISTDKAVRPKSVMGACKRAAEIYVQSLADDSPTCFVTVRFGNVLDSAGSVVQIFREQIAHGGPVTVTDPAMERYFMTIPEAAQLVIQAGAIGKGGQILSLDMGDPVLVVDLAKDLIRLSGYRPGDDIEIKFIGRRPGEKIAEELRAEGETCLATSHPKISVTASRTFDSSAAWESIGELEQLIDEPAEKIIAKLQSIVPEFRPEALPSQKRRAA
jgi:FlaA1/EpsC-like NDP-sugar epimerase